MNIGAARYWVVKSDAVHGCILVAATNIQYEAAAWPYEVIDRGPINLWTGEFY